MSAADSPLARLKANYEARQEADPDRFIDIWEDGHLVAKIARASDIASARGAMRTGAMLTALNGAELAVTVDDLADLVAAATVSLHDRQADGTLEPLLDAAGGPLRFDAAFGGVIGVPEVTTARGAVLVALTDGAPPALDATRLLFIATRVATVLAAGRQDAEAAVGEASALRS